MAPSINKLKDMFIFMLKEKANSALKIKIQLS